MTPEEKRRLESQAQDYWRRMKNLLVQQLQPGNRRGFAHGIDRWKFGEAGRNGTPPGGFSLPAGRSPSDTDVNRFIEFMGGNPYIKQLSALSADTSSATYGPGPGGPDNRSLAPLPSPDLMVQRMIQSNQDALDRANAANEARYAEGHGELSGLRDRNQERAKNFGIAASEDIDQRMQEALLDSEASLAARGLSGSTIQDAFRLRTAQNAAREQQRVREARDRLASETDTRDTGNLVGFVERREDTGPDANQLLQMVMQYSQDQQQIANQQKQAEEMRRLMALRGAGGRDAPVVRPGPQGGVRPMFMGANPVQLAGVMGMLPGVFGGSAVRGPRLVAPVNAPQPSTQGTNLTRGQVARVAKSAPATAPIAAIPGIGIGGPAMAVGAMGALLAAQKNQRKQKAANPRGTFAAAYNEGAKKRRAKEQLGWNGDQWMEWFAKGGRDFTGQYQ